MLDRLLNYRRWLVLAAELALFAVSGLAAFLLRFEFSIPRVHLEHLQFGLGVWLLAKPVVFALLRVDRTSWRHVSADDLARLAAGNLFGSLAGGAAILWAGPKGFPRSIYILDLLISFLLTAGLRVAARLFGAVARPHGDGKGSRRTLIYGAGDAGVTVLRETRQNPALPYRVLGFIDDDAGKSGLSVQGSKVLGRGESLPALVKKHAIQTVLIAIPSASGGKMTRILRLCQQAGVAYKTIPGLGEVIEGNGLAGQIRDVAVEDLLGRSPVRLEEDAIGARLRDRVVMVTGAAGSIGAELCRQIARFHPRAIVGFEIAESALFDLDREMRHAFPGVAFRPEIGSIRDPARLAEVFQQHAPAIVFHAAAYKHVPLMESHVFEAVENNVFGTYNVAVAATAGRAADFVLISSDKAVRPASVMGATKRLAELITLAFSASSARASFSSVRFGNVLGSSGSVIPIFKQQIAAGGPLTVTHPEMRRFFMTIPEACQLVLQASAMGEGGQIFVLDMGEPVKIVDLARNLILLSGLRPDDGIKIEFTGVRPGEKLYEELSTLLEDTAPTRHEKIRIYMGNGLPAGDMEGWLDSLRQICRKRDLPQLVLALKDIAPDYSPSAHLLRRLVDSRPLLAAAAAG